MPETLKIQINSLLNQTLIPLTLKLNEEEKVKVLEKYNEYIKTGNINNNDISTYFIYYTISNLTEDKQIEFIRENIEYINEHHNDIFLYSMLSPRSLSYYLSFKVLEELKKINLKIFKNIISHNIEYLFHGFKSEDYYNFYTEFYNEINEINNIEFIHGVDSNIKNFYCDNKKFILFILEKYKKKINSFSPKELLIFTQSIEDIDTYKLFLETYHHKLNNAFNLIDENYLLEFLSETSILKQEILIPMFFKNIIKKHNINKLIYKTRLSAILKLYNEDKNIFNELSLSDWIKISSKSKLFNEEVKKILDTFEIKNIEEIFDTNFYIFNWQKKDITALEYIEQKYRNSIKITNKLKDIDENTSIFSSIYLSNINELKNMFKNNTITKNDCNYKKHLLSFILFLKNNNNINVETSNLKEIEILFYRIVMGKPISIVYQLESIEEITLLNRLGKIDFFTSEFNAEQLEKYNVKQHKQLCKKYDKNDCFTQVYKTLILKLMLMVGFNNAKAILKIDDDKPVLEHLVGNVDVKNIRLDEQGNPILNTKLMNILFSNNYYEKIEEMLTNKDSDIYKYFPRIFNEWKMIQMNNKDKSLKTIIEFLKSDEILLPPKYYRLEGIFKHIGCKNTIVNETLSLHDQMLKRITSTIPRIKGTKDEYSYEILRLDDMQSLSVGNITDCCFTILGHGYSCLKHALTSTNGRILVIKKDNEIIAHSWIWRNGDLLCLDNIEIAKKITRIDFLDVYLQFSDEIIQKSFKSEGIETCIKNVSIGFTNFDKEIIGIENFPCLVSKNCNIAQKNFEIKLGSNKIFVDSLPQPIEKVNYSDSKNAQYLIRGNYKFNLGQSNFLYQDDRRNIMYYSSDNQYDDEYLKNLIKKVNGLRNIKFENSNYTSINITDCNEIYCNNDWYIVKYFDGEIESFNMSYDNRADDELESIINQNIIKLNL